MTIFLRKLERFSNYQSFQNQQKTIFYERKIIKIITIYFRERFDFVIIFNKIEPRFFPMQAE